MKKLLLFASLLVSALAADAQVTPKVQPETLVSGNQYVLVNKAQTATQYTSRTSWDGALYFLGETDSNWANYALTAVDNGDGTWSFTLNGGGSSDSEEAETPSVYYMVLPGGSANVNVNSEEPVKWILDKKDGGFYNLILGEGNSNAALAKAPYTPTGDLRMHLNASSQYFVVTYLEGPWYPDCAGGITETENDATGDVFFAANDSTSFNWGFVQPQNIPAYYADIQYSATINNFYEQYCDIEDYTEGFLTTYKAAADIYNSTSDPDALFEAGIPEMISAKVALYNEIEAAIALNENDDAVLAAAIANAKDIFNNQSDATAVENATQTLKQAEANYSLGSGEITSLGSNMSFEDLSAQGGNMTTGVAAPPSGWNIYINGKQIDSASGASAFGWHGVNDDAEGDPMDGKYAFGVWAGSVPTYEISQTITGLENGTYEISAGLMAGANGGGIRLTTQRLFGNLNATYFASQDDYNLSELDNSEIYAFAGNDEEVQTDRIMYPVTVKAFVYDGTLTFGVRTDGNTGAAVAGTGNAGSGWFKTDNFRIKTLGYNADDAVAIYQHYAGLLDEYKGQHMAAVVADELDATDLDKVTAANTQAEIIQGFLDARELLVTVDASVKAYEKLAEAIDAHFTYMDQYQYKAGVDEYSDVIYEAQDAYDEGTAADAAAVDSIIAGLNAALQACIQSDDIEEGQDLTEYIANASFEDLSAQGGNKSDGVANAPTGWNLYVEGEKVNSVAEAGVSGWCAINSGDNIDIVNTYGDPVSVQYTDGEHLWGLWSSAVPVIELSQTIEGLPAGTYTLSADIVVQNDWAGYNLGMQRLFANDYVTLFGAESDYVQNNDEELYSTFPEDVLVAAEIDKLTADADYKHLNYAGNYSSESYGASGAPYTTTITFGLAEKGAITLGFRSSRISAVDGQLSGQASLGWFKLDNFKLTFESFDVPAGAETTAEAVGIDAVQVAEKTAVEFYSINGVRLAAPQKGINIVKAGGQVKKVLVK